ncbi:unnamed protein product [Plutella xylostella]|uniref:(diamondback moth) hypothetical protein n=1 Tax=Plutella xylostella TaxID=51655 RepID=A0A8S4GEB2_PLUXY|nr:unnamed protein product [Plutella xylostella]
MSQPIKRSLSSEGGASKRDWKMRLSLRSRSGHSVVIVETRVLRKQEMARSQNNKHNDVIRKFTSKRI